jgi:hypothetical protein
LAGSEFWIEGPLSHHYPLLPTIHHKYTREGTGIKVASGELEHKLESKTRFKEK